MAETITRITPEDRRGDAIAIGLGAIGLVRGVFVIGARELRLWGSETAAKGAEAMRSRRAAHEAGGLTIAAMTELPVATAEPLADVVPLFPEASQLPSGVTPLYPEHPLQAA